MTETELAALCAAITPPDEAARAVLNETSIDSH